MRDVDVLKLRQAYYANGQFFEEEVKSFFEINDACRIQETTWTPLCVEAIADLIINDAEPQGCITKTNDHWLIDCISRDGIVDTHTELEVLLTVLDKWRSSLKWFIAFVLDQFKIAVCDGDGPLRAGTQLQPGEVTDDHLELIRRVLYAFGGDGNVAILHKEAEILFEIADRITDSEENSSFAELSIKAISNYVMAASGYSIPCRQKKLHTEAWLESRGDLSLGDMLSQAFQGFFGQYQEQTAVQRALARLEQQTLEIITNQKSTSGEANWLCDRIGRDGEITTDEKALLLCLKEASPIITPEPRPLLDKVDQAA